jgi:carbon monoxide dehydrogenase subunit G
VKVEGSRSFAAPRDTVWGVLNDPQAMAELMPGVESFDVQDDRHWIARVKIPLGLGGLRMKINFDKLEEREPEFARLRAKGQGVGALMDMVTQFNLDDVEGGTNMRWEADVKIAGPVGSMGQRVLQPIVNQQVSQVLNALDRQVQKVAASAGASSTSGGQPSTAGGSGGETSGTAGAPPPSTDAPTYTKPEFYEGPEPAAEPPAPPADSDSDGTSGADQGVSPWSPEGYDTDPEGPTTSTEDRG